MTFHTPLRLTTRFKGTVPKDSAYPDSNEDKLRICDTRQLYVLSDGASESYNSLLWAEVLVEEWSRSPPGNTVRRWLRGAIAEYESRSDKASMSWSQEAAFARGSFASLLAIQVKKDGEISVRAMGDSIVLVVSDGQVLWSFPYVNAGQFRARPRLLSTIFEKNITRFRHARISLRKGDCLLCVTDALGEWLLRECDDHSDRLRRVLNVTSEDAFDLLVKDARGSGAMRCDDTTLLVLEEASHAITHS